MAYIEESMEKLESRLTAVEYTLNEESNNLRDLRVEVSNLRENMERPLQKLVHKMEGLLAEKTPEDADPRPADPPGPCVSIQKAVEDGNMEIVFQLLENGADVRKRNELGYTLLHIAATSGHERVLVVLLGFGANADATGPLRRRPLHLAAATGHLGAVQRLLSAGAKANPKDSDGRTPLMLAAQRGHSQIVSLLLSHKVSSSDHDNNGDTALIFAAKGGHLNVVEAMTCKGHLDETDRDQDSAMVHAAKIGAWDIVEHLCKKGASAQVYHDVQNSPLSIAAGKGDVESVRCLLEFGEKNMFREEELKTALSRARDLSVVWAFEDALPGCVVGKVGEGAMRLAAQEGRLRTMVALLDTGIDIDKTNEEHGGTALIYACKFRQVECVKVLLERGADHSIKYRGGDTALHIASQEGYEEIVRVLLEAGADTSIANKSGKTPIKLAKTISVKTLLESIPHI